LKNKYGVKPVVLYESPDKGETVIEKFESCARFSCFVFVIITPDDFVKNKGKTYYQGRPNVLFELGWFCGRFGRDKVRILKRESVKKKIEMPSDLNGIITLDFNKKREEVSKEIGKDLEHNGIITKE